MLLLTMINQSRTLYLIQGGPKIQSFRCTEEHLRPTTHWDTPATVTSCNRGLNMLLPGSQDGDHGLEE